MTCIAAIVEGGDVWMGADSAGVAGLDLCIRRDPKIYRVKNILFGFTSSFRMGQLLGHRFNPPEHQAEWTIERYLHTVFIDAVRQTLKDGGFARTTNGEEQAGSFLVGYKGRLFNVCCDYQIAENVLPFNAVGCGALVALGALYVSAGKPPEKRLIEALYAAEAFSAGVRGPFIVEHLPA